MTAGLTLGDVVSALLFGAVLGGLVGWRLSNWLADRYARRFWFWWFSRQDRRAWSRRYGKGPHGD